MLCPEDGAAESSKRTKKDTVRRLGWARSQGQGELNFCVRTYVSFCRQQRGRSLQAPGPSSDKIDLYPGEIILEAM